jgi:hypothetical protein
VHLPSGCLGKLQLLAQQRCPLVRFDERTFQLRRHGCLQQQRRHVFAMAIYLRSLAVLLTPPRMLKA